MCINELNQEYIPWSMDSVTFKSVPRCLYTFLNIQLGVNGLPRMRLKDDFSHILPRWNEFMTDLDKIEGLPEMFVSSSY